MKQLFVFVSMLFTLSVFAQESVVLTNKSTTVYGSEVRIIRTNETPNNVEIALSVPMASSVCEFYDTRYVFRTSGLHCGYNNHVRRITERVCVRKNEKGACLSYQNRTRTQTVRVARSCSVPETYCARYGTATNYKTDTVKIQFKNLPKLADSEQDVFLLKAEQKRYDGTDVVFSIKPEETIRPYKVKQKKFLGLFSKDSFVVEEK